MIHKADPEVKAENNLAVTPEIFGWKQSELAGLIGAKFGAVHPAAERPRVAPAPPSE
ncbi:MAG TPA: hypothetical protein P5555_16455 [Candidatus Paceibacterota bacterium]|nr:hypothetical protein [Verrucomicrobiota bacterium]HOX03895.1 hypothetical protein [Verrucomicrobiota bacterium]HRZ46772.1 hypothetical protein [Candidatus Paceibacterota bacterium]HRZ93025.1 hypothetical protein [Candidatus Paceibacterota bacterium]